MKTLVTVTYIIPMEDEDEDDGDEAHEMKDHTLK